MDVFGKKASVLLSLLFLTSCYDPEVGSNKFSKTIEDEYCTSFAVKNQYVIKYKDGRLKVVTAESREELIEKYIDPELDDIEVVDRNIKFFTPSVDSIESKSLMYGHETWGQENIDAMSAWDDGFYGQGITVAVVDSGVNIAHKTLQNQIVINVGETGTDALGRDKRYNGKDDDNNGVIDDVSGYNFAANIPDNVENNAHGTHVAGIIANPHEEFFGEIVYGVAPKAKILPIDFIDSDGGTIQSAVDSLDYVIKMKDQFNIKVVNASWGGPICSTILETKIEELLENDILFVAAAGNDGINIDRYGQYPAAYKLPNIISVGAISPYLGMSNFTNYGDEGVDIFAPGEAIHSTVFEGSTKSYQGTSMAAPFVSGAAAVLWSKNPEANLFEIKEALLSSGDYRASYRSSTQNRLNLGAAVESLD